MSDRPQNGPEIEGPVREWLHAEARRGQTAPAALRERVNTIRAIAPDRTWSWIRFGSFQSLPAVAATVVIAVTLTAVGLGLVRPFLATSPDEPPIPSVSVSSAAPSAPESTVAPSPAPSATAEATEVPQAAWEVALMPDPAPGYRGALPADVVATDQGLVAVGGAGPCCADVSYTDPWQAFVWLSPDGAEWQVIEQPEQWDKLQFRAVAWNGSQLLAIAERIGPPPADELGGYSTSTETWLSSDGTEWELAADGEDLGSLNDVAAGGAGWVAAGSTGADAAAGIAGQPAIFASPDGRDWTATNLEGIGGLEHVAALPDGRLLAIGCDENPDVNPEQDGGSCVSRVWLSADGQAWDRVAQLDGYVRGLAVAPDGLIAAVGSPASGGLTAWLSNDEATWRSTPIGGGSAFAVAIVGGRIVVSGDDIGPDGVSVSAMWTSTDSGDTWASVPLEGVEGETSGSARMMVDGPGGIVVLGEAFIIGGVPVAWREPE